LNSEGTVLFDEPDDTVPDDPDDWRHEADEEK
jgi:hypothetical protein